MKHLSKGGKGKYKSSVVPIACVLEQSNERRSGTPRGIICGVK